MGHFGHKVCAGWCYQNKIAIPHEPDVSHVGFMLKVKQMVVDGMFGERADTQWCDEFTGGSCHHRDHVDASLFEAADEDERLIRCDAASDDKCHSLLHLAVLLLAKDLRYKNSKCDRH